MASLTLLIFIVLTMTNSIHATILSLPTTTIMENNTINITIDTDLNLVEIQLSTLISTPHLWKGFGFGSTSMFGTYAIIIDYTYPEQVPIIIETTLGFYNIGNIYTFPQIKIISDISNGITRDVKLQRTIAGPYSFPTTPQTFNIISAIGQQFDFIQCVNRRQHNCHHIPGIGRDIKSLQLVRSSTTSPSNIPTSEPTLQPINLSNNPTLNPSFNPIISPTINPSNFPSKSPTNLPTNIPIISLTSKPTNAPSQTNNPSYNPTTDPFTITCDSVSECKGKSMTCNGINSKYCNLKCVSELSCFQTVFTCTNNTNCNVLCNAHNSCESLSIIGGINSNLNITCNANSACNLANINGFNVNKLDLECFDEQSCNEMTIKCPSYTNMETVTVRNCKINAIGSQLVAHKMIIYAENSWSDINVQESYISSNTQVEMYCHSDTSKCTLTQHNGTWNCLENESLCFIGNNMLPYSTIATTDISTTLQVISTENIGDSKDTEHIIIICDKNNPCDTDIICTESNCRIICYDNSCACTNIYGMDGSGNSLSVECIGISSCKMATFYGSDLIYLTVKCSGFQACEMATFFESNTNLLNIECLHFNGSCQNMNVYCPLNHNGCIISNNGKQSNDIHTQLDFYAIHGFDDLDITEYKAIVIMNENSTNMMHCGIDYKSVCKLNESLYCKCDYYNEILINENGNNEQIELNSIKIIAIFISALVLIIIIGVIGFCVLCDMKRDNNNNKSYESVKINDTTNVEMQDIVELQTDKSIDSDTMTMNI